MSPIETPDGRPGIGALLFAMDTESLGKRLVERIGQTVLTCPTANCFDGLRREERRLTAGRALRVFGDGFQASKVVGGERYWRIPVMDGECLVQESFGAAKRHRRWQLSHPGSGCEQHTRGGRSGGEARSPNLPGVILPFPGGVARSGSKIGSRRYSTVPASTNDAYCPTLRPMTASALPDDVHSVLEIVLDGLDEASIARSMRDRDRRSMSRGSSSRSAPGTSAASSDRTISGCAT